MMQWSALQRFILFLSTPSARRATWALSTSAPKSVFLSTPSARRATKVAPHVFLAVHISIHALREEGDLPSARRHLQYQDFYPRPPRGGRPRSSPAIPTRWLISIHALREEGDCLVIVGGFGVLQFLSTPSARRATAAAPMGCLCAKISIHALREEGDSGRTCRVQEIEISIHALREEGDS